MYKEVMGITLLAGARLSVRYIVSDPIEANAPERAATAAHGIFGAAPTEGAVTVRTIAAFVAMIQNVSCAQ